MKTQNKVSLGNINGILHIFAKGKYYKCLKIINYVGQPARSPRALPQTGVMVG